MTNISEMKRLLAQQGHYEDSLLVIDVIDLEQAQFPEDQSRAHANLGDSLKRHGLLDISSIRSIYSALKPANISASTSTMMDPRALPSDPPGTMYPPQGLTKCPVPNGKRFKVRWSRTGDRTGDWTSGETAPYWSWGAPDIAAYVIIEESKAVEQAPMESGLRIPAGWTRNTGGIPGRPLEGTKVDVMRGTGSIQRGLIVGDAGTSCDLSWSGCDHGNVGNIYAYQIVEAAKPKCTMPSDYTPWDGSSDKCPVPNGANFVVWFHNDQDVRNGKEEQTAPYWGWSYSRGSTFYSIIGYKITKAAAPILEPGWVEHKGGMAKRPPVGTKVNIRRGNGIRENNLTVGNFREACDTSWMGKEDGSTNSANIVAYQIVADAPSTDGWIKVDGSGIPSNLPHGTRVNLRRRDPTYKNSLNVSVGESADECNGCWGWKGTKNVWDIMEYQIIDVDDVWKDMPAGYTKWNGKSSTCPIPHGKKFKVWFKKHTRGGEVYTSPAFDWGWSTRFIDCDVIGYQLVEDELSTTAEPDSQGWIKHDGDYYKQPPHGTIVNVKRYSSEDKCQNVTVGDSSDHCDSYWRWEDAEDYDGNIIAYQIIPRHAENPWITHDGKGKPVPDGTIVNV